mmetsp:Transcript_28943/g.63813  ORF Transcript_28943/g.63813 Transcript_28943/m.63813 type:complete len:314 (+) Transcript_28943:407-1348(+)
MEEAFLNFLKLTSGLSPSTLEYWEVYYQREAVMQVLSDSSAHAVLRPPGFEHYPLILDPANITNNVALGMPRANLEALINAAKTDLGVVTVGDVRRMRAELDGCQALVKQLMQDMKEQQTVMDQTRFALHAVVGASSQMVCKFTPASSSAQTFTAAVGPFAFDVTISPLKTYQYEYVSTDYRGTKTTQHYWAPMHEVLVTLKTPVTGAATEALLSCLGGKLKLEASSTVKELQREKWVSLKDASATLTAASMSLELSMDLPTFRTLSTTAMGYTYNDASDWRASDQQQSTKQATGRNQGATWQLNMTLRISAV